MCIRGRFEQCGIHGSDGMYKSKRISVTVKKHITLNDFQFEMKQNDEITLVFALTESYLNKNKSC